MLLSIRWLTVCFDGPFVVGGSGAAAAAAVSGRVGDEDDHDTQGDDHVLAIVVLWRRTRGWR